MAQPQPLRTLTRLSTRFGRAATLFGMVALLSACGGGGSADAGNTNNYNLDAAITRALVGGVQISGLTGSFGGVGYTLSLAYAPLPDAVFEGASRKAVRQTVTITGGGSTDTTSGVVYFGVSPYADVGTVADDGSVEVAVPTGTLPTVARVASSGPLSTSTTYADATKRVVDATTTTTWSLDADSDTTALACLRVDSRETGVATPVSGRLCFRINTAGDVLGAVVVVSSGGNSIEFR
jgi:hypothetical protein